MVRLGPFASNVLQRLDVRTGEIKQCALEPIYALQEACFVPRTGAQAEGDGYVMVIGSNYESTSSDLLIVDAQKMEQGVIATVKLPFRLRSGTHTNWYPQSVLPPIQDQYT